MSWSAFLLQKRLKESTCSRAVCWILGGNSEPTIGEVRQLSECSSLRIVDAVSA